MAENALYFEWGNGQALIGAGLAFAPKPFHPCGLEQRVGPNTREYRACGAMLGGVDRHGNGLGHGDLAHTGICTHHPGGASMVSGPEVAIMRTRT